MQEVDKVGKCHELRGRDIFGRRFHITTFEIFRIIRDWRTSLYLALAVAVLVAVDAYQYQEKISVGEDIVVWGASILAHVTLFVSFSLLWALGQTRFRLVPIYLPVFSLVAFSFVVQINGFLLSVFSGESFAFSTVSGRVLSGIVVVLIFEALFFAFVFPLLHDEDNTPAPTPRREVTGAGMSFAIEQLLFIRGQEHYVQIVTTTGQHRLRARLGDLVSQTDPGDGIQAHRSHWVAGSAIDRLICESGNDVIVLINGEKIKVARPRRDDVRAWLTEHCPDVPGIGDL